MKGLTQTFMHSGPNKNLFCKHYHLLELRHIASILTYGFYAGGEIKDDSLIKQLTLHEQEINLYCIKFLTTAQSSLS